MSKEPHVHKFDTLATVKVPLLKYETIEMVTLEDIDESIAELRQDLAKDE